MPGYIFSSFFLLLIACSNTSSSAPGISTTDSLPVGVASPAIQPSIEKQPEIVPKKVVVQTESRKSPTSGTSPKKRIQDTPKVEKPVETRKDTTEPMSLSVVVSNGATVERPHIGLDTLLQKHVSAAGAVNYKGLQSDKAALNAYCQTLSDNPPDDTWSREATMAFWINAYNAFTLKLIVDNYPTKSIINFDGGKTWDVRRIRIGDVKYSLNNIENDILRPVFKDPRIHFAVNCAAKSCPPLWNHAYTAENLESTLESRTRAFVNSAAFNTISANRAQVSKIFEWYGVDFGNLRIFLNKYSETQLNNGAAIRFNEYDWDLNKQE